MRRVVVTGIGVVSAIGQTTDDFWRSLSTGTSGIAPLTVPDPGRFRFKQAAEVRGYEPLSHFDEKRADLLDRFAQFAVVAARAAVADAGVDWTPRLRERTAVVTGSCVGGQSSEDAGFFHLYHERRPGVHPLTIPRIMANAGASHVTVEFGITGPSFTISTACASATHALGQAFWLVRSGTVEMALAGGSEAPFSVGNMKAWDALRVVSADTCRPFSRNRSGMILGEGAALLVLEPYDAARARGARIWGEVLGFGMSSDAGHITQPSAEGAARAMRMAIEDARLSPDAIGYVNAHGTATAVNDVTESEAIRSVFEARTDALPVSSTKAMHGHALGAAGALEAAATLLALHHGLLPPTVNFVEPDPKCALDVVPNQARPASVEYALSNSFAFGGMNAVVALGAP
jgi:nodulation protein E